MVQVAVIDEHPVGRAGMVAILDGDPTISVWGDDVPGEPAPHGANGHPDVVVLALGPARQEAWERCRRLRERPRPARVLLAVASARTADIVAGFAAGAHGMVCDDVTPELLRSAVHAVARGDMFIDPRLTSKVVELALTGQRVRGMFGLTPQEQRVLRYLGAKWSNRGIADELGVTVDTVKTHVRNVLRKLEVSSRQEAAEVARQRGMW